jgi:hypothetical protein
MAIDRARCRLHAALWTFLAFSTAVPLGFATDLVLTFEFDSDDRLVSYRRAERRVGP